MARRTAMGIRLGLAFTAVLAASCDDEVCKKGRSECLSESLLRTCIPSVDGTDDNQWAVTQCEPDETCENDALAGVIGAAQSTADGGADAGTTPPTAAPTPDPATGLAGCVGTCTLGASECASDTLARHCVDGRAWQLEPCDPGTLCVDGICRISPDGGLRVCDTGQRSCASRDVERECAGDGSGWVEADCEEGEACLVDRCAPDPDASCDEPSQCLDDKTALRCLGEANGFEAVTCENDNWCEAGRCRGSACVLGSICVALNQIRDCVDGETLTDTQCAANEVCKQDGDHASCVPATCVPGATVCGDPRDPAVDDTKFYATCEDGASTPSGVPEWVVTECTDLLTCDPVFAGTPNPCRQDCTPGAEACAAAPASGVSDGWVTCRDDGTWGPIERCDAGTGQRLLCAIPTDPDASVLPTHVCAEPVCAWIIDNRNGVGGVCEQGEIRACDASGVLGDLGACDVGVCRPVSALVQDDGQVPGACDEDLECEDTEERCVYDALTPTPLFQTCEATLWSAQLNTCAGDEICVDFLDPDTELSQKICGADCVPGSRRCNMNGALQTCNDQGEWGQAETCNVGTCQALGINDAGCILSCVPGTDVCGGGPALASDGVSIGEMGVQACDADGVLGALTPCPAGEVCRESRLGESLGCLECLGTQVLGGNDFGYADTRCDPADTTRVQECGANNMWNTSRACAGGKTCIGPLPDTCGNCLSDAGNVVVCTATNVNEQGVCGPCNHGSLSGPLTSCTNTAIQADTTGAETCLSLFGDDPLNGDASGMVAWGGEPDCCDDGNIGAGQFLLNNSCATMGYGAAMPWGGEPDCCASAIIAAGATDFAYCGN